jgi:hypothetical protein
LELVLGAFWEAFKGVSAVGGSDCEKSWQMSYDILKYPTMPREVCRKREIGKNLTDSAIIEDLRAKNPRSYKLSQTLQKLVASLSKDCQIGVKF